jgi:hypothetical protein
MLSENFTLPVSDEEYWWIAKLNATSLMSIYNEVSKGLPESNR